MTDFPNIAIVGRMYAGKTTLATELVNQFGYTRVAMAGPLKQLALLAYGEDIVKDKDYPVVLRHDGRHTTKTGREILQGIGQAIKDVDRDIWLKMFINDTTRMGRFPYVVDDVRFDFEANYLREQGWTIVKVDTPDKVRMKRAASSTGRVPTHGELTHESEIGIDLIKTDLVVPGDMDLAMLPEIAKSIVER